MDNNVLMLDEKSADDFWRLRKALFEELNEIKENTNTSELESATKQYYLSHINKDLLSWGILCDNKLAAIGSLCLFYRIPYEDNLSGSEGYILNIYTSPQFRRNGFANQILDEIIKYALENNINRLWLSSSQQAKELYGKRGFITKCNEMELFLS